MIAQHLWVYDLETGEKLFPALAGGVDNTELNAGSGGDTIASDDIAGVKYQRVKLVEGADGTNDGDISSANPLPVDVSDSATRDLGKVDIAAFDAALPAGDNNIGNVDIVTFPTEAHSADFDTGAGTDTTLAFGIAVPANGGAAVVPGDATAGLKVDLGADNDVTVSGTVTANLGTIADVATQTTLSAINAKLVTGTDIGDVTINNASGASAVNIQDGGNSITVDGTVTCNAGTGTLAVSLASVPSHAVTNAGTFATQVTSLPASTNTIEVVGDVAHDAVAAGNPVGVGGIAKTGQVTAVADGDAVRIMCDDQGRVVTSPHSVRDLVNIQQTNLANTTETTIVTAAASTFHDIAAITVHNAGAALNQVTIRDSTAGTVRFVLQLAANGGGTILQPCIPIPQATVNNNWTAQASVTGDVDISVVYIKRT